MKKTVAIILSLVLIVGIISPNILLTFCNAEESSYSGIVDNGGSEDSVYTTKVCNDGTAQKVSNQKYNGNYSTKITSNVGKDIACRLEIDSTGENYSKIPLNKKVYITFWAKADETDGFNGVIYARKINQKPKSGSDLSLSGNTDAFAFGTKADASGYSEIPKDWNQYFITVNNNLVGGYNSFYAYIDILGKGTIYIDDFDIIDPNAGLVIDGEGYDGVFENGGSESGVYKLGSGGVTATTLITTEEKRSGSASTKFISKSSGINANLTLTSINEKYDSIPKGRSLYLSFWAKADEKVGFTGAICSGNVYQSGKDEDGKNIQNKIDGYTTNYGFGKGAGKSTWEEVSKEWSHYFIAIKKPLLDGFESITADLTLYGNGIIYIDDFDLCDPSVNKELYDGYIDNGGYEFGVPPLLYPVGKIEQSRDEKHSGNCSAKISNDDSGAINTTIAVNVTGDNYDNLPLGTQLYFTFWAKADETLGFNGILGTGIVYQEDNEGNQYKLDAWQATLGFGKALLNKPENYVEISKDWTKYYVKINKELIVGYTKLWSNINIMGTGALYIDDFNIEKLEGSSGEESPLRVYLDDKVFGARYYQDVADPTFQISQGIKLTNVGNSLEVGILKYTVIDDFDNEVADGDIEILVAPKATSEYVIDCSPVSAYGIYYIDCSVERTDGSTYYVGKVSLSRLKKVPEIYQSDLFGINMHFDTQPGTKQTIDDARKLITPLAAAGMTTIRTSFIWANYEKQKGVFDFGTVKEYFDVAKEFGIEIAPVVKEGNSLYGDRYSDEAIKAFANYCGEFVKYLGDRIHYILVSNEPNINEGVDPVGYTKLLKAVYEKVKLVNPSIKVVGGELSGYGNSFLKQMLENGAYSYMDAVGIHPYIYPDAPEECEIDYGIKGIANLLAKYSPNGKTLPIWCDEFGYFTSGTDNLSPPVNEETQAVYLVRQLAAFESTGLVEKAFTYVAYDTYDNYDMSEGNYGIIRHGASDRGSSASKPAHLMLAGHMNATGGKKFIKSLNNSAEVNAYLYSCGDGTNVYMLWSHSGDKDCKISLSGDDINLYDCYGNSKYAVVNNNSFDVTLGSRPIYLQLKSNATITNIIKNSIDDDDNDFDDEYEDEYYEEYEDDYEDEDYLDDDFVGKSKKKKKVIVKKVLRYDDTGLDTWIIVVIVCAVVLAGGGFTTFFIIKKRKKSKK